MVMMMIMIITMRMIFNFLKSSLVGIWIRKYGFHKRGRCNYFYEGWLPLGSFHSRYQLAILSFRWGLKRRCCNDLRRQTRCWPTSIHCQQPGLSLPLIECCSSIYVVHRPSSFILGWIERLQTSRNTQQWL